MQEATWINKYIPLADQYPDTLANAERDKFSERNKQQFQARAQNFSKICLEIGSGSGAHLLEQAVRHPDELWVGIELRYKRAVRTIQKAEQQCLNNVFIFRGRAEQAQNLFERESINRIYVNFPDPWEKARWKKHRILSLNFLKQIYPLLKSDGLLSFKTDHAEYFHHALQTIENSGLFETIWLSQDLHCENWERPNVMSEFEMLFKSKGLPVHLVEARKIRGSAGSEV